MLILHALPPIYDEPSASPFVIKAMCLLGMAGLAWRPDYKADIRKAPKKKFPVLVDDGQVIDDSAAIRRHLETRHGAAFELGMSNEDKANAHMLTRMVEEHLYFTAVYNRWANEASWADLKAVFFSDLPPVIRSILPGVIRRDILKSLNGQGIGRMSEAEIAGRLAQDLNALKTALGDKQFLFGDAPTAADASAGPMIAALSSGDIETRLSRLVNEDAALTAYRERVRAALYPKDAAG